MPPYIVLPYTLYHTTMYLSVCLSVCLPVCLSACLPVCLSCLSVCLSVCLPVCLSVCLSACLPVYRPFKTAIFRLKIDPHLSTNGPFGDTIGRWAAENQPKSDPNGPQSGPTWI